MPKPVMRLILAGAGIAIFVITLLPPAWAAALLAEHAAIELFSALVPLAAAGMLLIGPGSFNRLMTGTALAGFAYRESDIDLHKAVFSIRIFRLSDYGRPEFGFAEKFAAATLACSLLTGLGVFLWRLAPIFVRDLRAGQPYARACLLGLIMLVLGGVVAENIHKAFSQAPSRLGQFLWTVEEVLELAGQFCLFWSVILWRRLEHAPSAAYTARPGK